MIRNYNYQLVVMVFALALMLFVLGCSSAPKKMSLRDHQCVIVNAQGNQLAKLTLPDTSMAEAQKMTEHIIEKLTFNGLLTTSVSYYCISVGE